MHHFFFLRFLDLLAQAKDPSLKKTDSEKHKTDCCYQMDRSPWPRYSTIITKKKMDYDYLFIFRRFWVKEPRRSKNKIAKKKVYLYRVTRLNPLLYAGMLYSNDCSILHLLILLCHEIRSSECFVSVRDVPQKSGGLGCGIGLFHARSLKMFSCTPIQLLHAACSFCSTRSLARLFSCIGA